ncbi:MAG: substrate-binding domain-containing protein [Candidatus Latescibacterota bacterium]|nr:substrate-binding domain-containing protein [Candidatus Latescibacterota bacterium]
MYSCLLLVIFMIAGCGGGGEGEDDRPLKVGYVVNFMSHEWYQNITKSATARAEELGVELIIADANMDMAAQISKAENLMAQQVDVLILTPVDAKALGPVVRQARDQGIHVLTESNPVEGSLSYIGINNHASGKKAGIWFAERARYSGMDPKILVVGYPNFEDCRQRVAGFKEGLKESGLVYEIVQEVSSSGLKEQAFKVTQDAITAHPEINVIFGINDDSTTGGMSAFRAAGLDEANLVAIGFGFEGVVGRVALLAGGSYQAALAMFPEFVGTSLIDAAIKVAGGEMLPTHYETPTLMITLDNFEQFYEPSGDDYVLKLDAVRQHMQ